MGNNEKSPTIVPEIINFPHWIGIIKLGLGGAQWTGKINQTAEKIHLFGIWLISSLVGAWIWRYHRGVLIFASR